MSGHMHDDVAGLKGRVVGQQSHQQFAEHLDLTVGPVRGVELDAPVVPLQQVALVVGRQPPVRGEVGLQPGQQGPPLRGAVRRRIGQVLIDHGVLVDGSGEDQLQLPGITAEIGQQPMIDQILGAVGGPPLLGLGSRQLSGEPLPEHAGRVWQPQVDVTVGRHRDEHPELVRIEPGRAEHRQALRQVQRSGSGQERGLGGGDLLRRARHRQLVPQPAPQFGLPGAVARQRSAVGIHVQAPAPVVDHGRPGRAVPGEEVGQMPGRRPAAATADRIGFGAALAEIGPQQFRPGLTAAAVDHRQQWPDGALRLPGVDVRGTG